MNKIVSRAMSAGRVDKRTPIAWAEDCDYGRGYSFAEEFFEAFPTFPNPPADPAKASEHERDMLANAIRDAAIKAGIAREDVVLTGPHLLMLCDDLATAAKAGGSAPEVTDHDLHHATSAVINDPHHNGGAAWQWQRGVLHHKSVGHSNWVKVSSMSPTPKRILAISAALTAALQEKSP